MTKRKTAKVPQSAQNQEFRDTAIQLALAGNKPNHAQTTAQGNQYDLG